jgi:molecular chaperone DnaK (HSP70)
VVLETKRLVGTKRSASYEALFPWTKLSTASDGAAEVEIDAPEKLARGEELLAAALGEVRQTALSTSVFKFFGVNIVDRAVITVPSHFSASRRAAVTTAATLAGLRVDLVDELGAAAIDFAVSHLPPKGPASETFVIYGAGATGVSASLVRVAVDEDGALNVRVLADESDGTVGAADIDELLTLRVEAAHTGGRNALLREARARLRLRTAVRRAKEDCRSDTCPVVVKELADGVDYASKFTRADLDAAQPILERMAAPLRTLLARVSAVSGVTPSDVKSVDLFGGATRLPQLQKLLTGIAKAHNMALGHRLNTELSAAQGAARFGASIADPTARRVKFERNLPLPAGDNDVPPMIPVSVCVFVCDFECWHDVTVSVYVCAGCTQSC